MLFRKLLVGLLLSTLAACANTNGGGEDKMSMAYLKQHLVVNQTTKADVAQMFGEPHYKQEQPNGADYWSYTENQINGTDYVAQAAKYLPSFGGIGSTAMDTQKRKTDRNLAIDFNSKGTVSGFHTYGSTGSGS